MACKIVLGLGLTGRIGGDSGRSGEMKNLTPNRKINKFIYSNINNMKRNSVIIFMILFSGADYALEVIKKCKLTQNDFFEPVNKRQDGKL